MHDNPSLNPIMINHSTDVSMLFSSTHFNGYFPSGCILLLLLLLLKGLPQFKQGQSSHDPSSLKQGQRVVTHLGLWSLDDIPQEHLFTFPLFFLCFPGGVTTTVCFCSILGFGSGSTLSTTWISSLSSKVIRFCGT